MTPIENSHGWKVVLIVAAPGIVPIGGPRSYPVDFPLEAQGKLSRITQVRRYGFALVLQLGAFVIGAFMLRGDSGAAYWLVAVELVLLVAGARNSWEILIETGAL